MRILKITTYWTPDEAEAIYQFLDDWKEAIWQSYGEEMVEMHKAIHDQQQIDHDHEERGLNDEIPF